MDDLIKKLLSVLIEHITTEVTKHQQDAIDAAIAKAFDGDIKEKVESIVEEKVEEALNGYDPTDDHRFNDAVVTVINNGEFRTDIAFRA